MDVLAAIAARKSVRRFKPDPVPRQVLERLIQAAQRSPSWGNTQPWELAITGGKAHEELQRRLAEKAAQDAPSKTDLPRPTFPEAYTERNREATRRRLELLGIARDDTVGRRRLQLSGARFFEAPSGIIIYIDKALDPASNSPYPILDVGLVAQTIMLGALELGLGTCMEAMVVRYPEVLRELLHIPETKLIVIGLAIGYPDETSPDHDFHSERLPLEKVATWHGL